MSKDNFPVNEAKPFVETPIEIPLIGFLGGEYGKEINDSIKKDYESFPTLQIANYSGQLIRGSNPFYAVAVQERLPSGMKVASQSDLEKALKWQSLDLKGIYVDSSLVLRTEGNPNSYLAKNLINQIKKRNPKARMPVMIPLSGLELIQDSNSDYGLSFELKENAEIIYAPILNKESGNFSSEKVNLKTGLPTKLGQGNRSFYARKDGLSRVYLNEDSDVNSNDGSLQGSDSDGRVVVVNAEGVAPEILQAYYNRLNESKQQLENKIKTKISRLENIEKEHSKQIESI